MKQPNVNGIAFRKLPIAEVLVAVIAEINEPAAMKAAP